MSMSIRVVKSSVKTKVRINITKTSNLSCKHEELNRLSNIYSLARNEGLWPSLEEHLFADQRDYVEPRA